ncbi:hypothetical protein ACTXT7_007568 [Hymenolepis weldensis]
MAAYPFKIKLGYLQSRYTSNVGYKRLRFSGRRVFQTFVLYNIVTPEEHMLLLVQTLFGRSSQLIRCQS